MSGNYERFKLSTTENYSEPENLQLFLNELRGILHEYEQRAANASMDYCQKACKWTWWGAEDINILRKRSGQNLAHLETASSIIESINNSIRRYWPAR